MYATNNFIENFPIHTSFYCQNPKKIDLKIIFPTEKALSNWPIFWSVSVSAGWFNDDNAQQDDHRRQPVPDRVKDPQQRPAGIKNLKSEIKNN